MVTVLYSSSEVLTLCIFAYQCSITDKLLISIVTDFIFSLFYCSNNVWSNIWLYDYLYLYKQTAVLPIIYWVLVTRAKIIKQEQTQSRCKHRNSAKHQNSKKALLLCRSMLGPVADMIWNPGHSHRCLIGRSDHDDDEDAHMQLSKHRPQMCQSVTVSSCSHSLR